MSASNARAQSSKSETTIDDSFVKFPPVSDGKINTEKFLNAARGVVRLVDKFGKIFVTVKFDMEGNIGKLHAKYVADKENHSTLQDMVLLEKMSGQNPTATDALMWLRRGLYLIQLFFEKIVEDHKAGKATDDLVASLKRSYKEALEPYHGWMAQQLFGLLLRMVPTKTQLLQALVNERRNEDLIIQDLELFLALLRKNVENLLAFYIEHNLENDAKV